MALAEQITQDLKDAMKAKEQNRLLAIRAVRGEIIKLQKSGNGDDVADDAVVSAIKKLIKEKNETIEMYTNGGKPEEAEKEIEQVNFLQKYLPPALSEEEVKDFIKQAIETTGAATMKDMGNVMKTVRELIQQSGKDADMGSLSQEIKGLLS